MTKSEIISKLDEFVANHGNGVYAYEDDKITRINPNPNSTVYGVGGSFDYPIQQSRNEIYALIDVLIQKPQRNAIVETGCGEWGGSHFLWQMLFDKVITIEHTQSIIDKITYPLTNQDIFIIQDSQTALDSVLKVTDSIDVLFLDSMHVYSILTNEYKLYNSLVRKDGLIVFHDALSPLFPDVSRFLTDLQSGLIDGKKHEITMIDDSPLHKIGIAYMRG